jgi:glycosyltransferase involved in cell wall biosynthesis
MVLFSYYPGDPRPRRAAEALVNAGMSVDLICLREDAGDAKFDEVNGVKIRRVPLKRRRGGLLGYLYQYLAFLVASSAIIVRRMFSQRYDLVYVHNMPDFLVLSGLIPRMFGAKVILDLHDPMPELMRTIYGFEPDALAVRLLKFVEKRSLALADRVVTVNHACAKLFAARSCPAEKIVVVMNSPDEGIFKSREGQSGERTASGDRPFVVMYHGSLVERNGLGLAVDALEIARKSVPNAELHVYGAQNAFLDSVMDSVRSRGLASAVHYMGSRPLEKIVEAIQECHVGIIPNLKNIFTELNTPTRIFEYLALGKPVIAPRSAGITAYFDDESLVFFELGDANDLAKKIEYVFRNPREVREITRKGEAVHRAHVWRAERQKLTGLVSELLPGRTF